MAFTLYEIWSEDADRRQELIDTAANLPEAIRIAKNSIGDEITQTVIFEEGQDGEVFEIKRFRKD